MPADHGIEVHDLVGLSQPLTKLMETVSCGVGKIYEPYHIKRMAKAKAQEIEIITAAVNENLLLPTKYENGKINVDATDIHELLQRAKIRSLFQEMNKQQNIDAIVKNAYEILEDSSWVSEEPVDQNWIARFFDSVASISNDDLRVIWGKILADEIKQPGSCSLRTLETVKNISKKEAEIFLKIIPLVLKTDDGQFLYADADIFKKYNIIFNELMQLSDCGLMDATGTIYRAYDIAKASPVTLFYRNNIFLMTTGQEAGTLSFRVCPLSTSGCELFNTLEQDADVNYFVDVSAEIWKHNSNRLLTLRIFERDHIDSETHTFNYYETTPFKEYK